MKKEDFIYLANIVVDIFNKTECTSVYYVPFGNGRRCGGKLWDAYNNKKRLLSAAGVIKRRFYTHSDEKGDNRRTKSCNDVILPENLRDSFTFITTTTEPWFKVKEHWQATYSYRNSLLSTCESAKEFMTKFPPFSKPNGFELVRSIA